MLSNDVVDPVSISSTSSLLFMLISIKGGDLLRQLLEIYMFGIVIDIHLTMVNLHRYIVTVIISISGLSRLSSRLIALENCVILKSLIMSSLISICCSWSRISI